MYSVPNSTVEGEGFYVSFNAVDIRLYGCETTALVLGVMEKFYILKGDHRAQYAERMAQGFDACLAYFEANPNDVHPCSDKVASSQPAPRGG